MIEVKVRPTEQIYIEPTVIKPVSITPQKDQIVVVDTGKVSSVIRGINGKSPYIGDNGNWFIYDDAELEYIDSGIAANSSYVELGRGLTRDTENKITLALEELEYMIDCGGAEY